MMFKKPEDLLKGLVQVSSLPAVYTKINEAVNNPQSSMKGISDIISDDPGLTSRLLQLVNSAFYSFPSRIETVSRALFIVGTQQLRDLALATSIMNMFKGIPEDLVNMESFWRHSVACGLTAKILATYRRCEMNVERFFAAGIIHDIGRLIIYKKIPETAREMILRCKANRESLFLVEKEIIGFDHSDLGRILVQFWNLPPSLEEVVAYHHSPREARRYPIETAVVHIADIIANAMQFGNSGEQYIPRMDEKAWELIGIPTSALSPTMDQLEREIKDVVQSLFGKPEYAETYQKKKVSA
ncbi:MAG TPA: HDOD domain-containing protein [Syntrophales bacterium]|nr:HDOD domain-containing protein [Syntrophales bacterium]